MAKPIEKKEESDPVPTEVKSKFKNKKMLLIIMSSVLILGIAGGAGWYFTKGENHNGKSAKKISKLSEQPKFIALEPFTVNLQRETADQFLQIGITLKIVQPELEEKIKQNLPEIRSRLLVLLSGKYPSELTASKGKKKLVNEIIAETEIVLGLRTAPTLLNSIADASAKSGVVSSVEAASSVKAASSVDATSSEESSVTSDSTEESAKPNGEKESSIVDVLFTSFIIQ
ncbi:flagellar basal body-associated FliL family protein [Candidatus Nitrotoga sp. 1052]|uniref:flagellar basal body-associated FliL family protein n=1 Tax=Candidatus Nitrotoga sp. 1052 TaxID=2886964 RepID=UPI001EF4B470|nr:flagellar basal body-associated FliL family protein [Candidatus Nitrotoga sp. 1052]CAH1073826.1 Flagellar protein FliL [Candidatus Nitrotoga sp. 1052]